MALYYDQIQRIIEKLALAKRRDSGCSVFGASRHKYTIGKPASADEVAGFENQYGIELPECYKAFITQIGNGGEGYADSAAGPAYGIYPLGRHVGELLLEFAETHLKNECILDPEITEETWDQLTCELQKEDLPDAVYDRELAKLYGGILPIGSQGCTYLHALILNGKHKGRVINMDLDRQMPHVAKEKNFLDWYEAWLDEVIAGRRIG